MTLDRLLSRRLLFVLGPGGAGKTSLAAALGLLAAERGRRALVLTLDPARRLAEALRLVAGERVFSPEELRAAAVAAAAPLEAAVFDPRRSWIDLLAREVPDLETRRRLLTHPFFVRLSEDLAGSREYAALAEILAVFRAGRHDLVILDTPPAEHGLDFLDAAERVLAALDADALSWLAPLGLARRALRLTGWASGYIARTLARFTGAAFLEELGGFLELGSVLLPRVRERAAELRALLQSEECGSVLVTRAGEGPVRDALSLWAAVTRRARRPEAVVANLLTPQADLRGDAALDPAVRAGAQRVLSFLAAIAGGERAALARLREGLPAGATLVRVPAIPGEIVDLAGLAQLCRALQRAFAEA
jgi:anion-transporting  ArsA/GET3 family ATPase